MSFLELSLLLLPPIAAAVLLKLWTVARVNADGQTELNVTGFKAASRILETAEASEVDVQQTPGASTDHYDPLAKVVRLSTEVYHGRTVKAVAIAGREACHAIHHRHQFGLIVLRGIAAGFATFGMLACVIVLIVGALLGEVVVFACGVAAMYFVFVVQLINLPIELKASRSACDRLAETELIDQNQLSQLRRVSRAEAYATIASPLKTLVIPFTPLVGYFGGKQ